MSDNANGTVGAVTLYGQGAVSVYDGKDQYIANNGQITVPARLVPRMIALGFTYGPTGAPEPEPSGGVFEAEEIGQRSEPIALVGDSEGGTSEEPTPEPAAAPASEPEPESPPVLTPPVVDAQAEEIMTSIEDEAKAQAEADVAPEAAPEPTPEATPDAS